MMGIAWLRGRKLGWAIGITSAMAAYATNTAAVQPGTRPVVLITTMTTHGPQGTLGTSRRVGYAPPAGRPLPSGGVGKTWMTRRYGVTLHATATTNEVDTTPLAPPPRDALPRGVLPSPLIHAGRRFYVGQDVVLGIHEESKRETFFQRGDAGALTAVYTVARVPDMFNAFVVTNHETQRHYLVTTQAQAGDDHLDALRPLGLKERIIQELTPAGRAGKRVPDGDVQRRVFAGRVLHRSSFLRNVIPEPNQPQSSVESTSLSARPMGERAESSVN